MPIRVIVVSLITLLLAVSCDETTEEGEVFGINMGQSERDVIQTLKDREIQKIGPFAEAGTIDYSNVDSIYDLAKGHDLCMGDNSGTYLRMGFDENGKLSSLTSDHRTEPGRYGLSEGQTKSQVLESLKPHIARYGYLKLSNCIIDHRWIDLAEITEEDISYLTKFSSWRFHEREGHSHYSIYFSEDGVSKVVYHWRPFEM